MSAPPRVLVAGLPDAAAAWLARELRGVTVESAADAAHARARMNEGGWALVLLDDALPGGSGRAVLRDVAPPARAPVFLCLRRGDAPTPTREDLVNLGITRLFFHPLDRQELARECAALVRPREQPAPGAPAAPQGSLQHAVSQAWERFREPVLRRVDAVEAAALAVLEGGLDEETRRAAEREAHKLAGSVGTFGFANGSRHAREVERILRGSAPLAQADALRLTDLAVALRRELAKPPSSGTTSGTSAAAPASSEPPAASGDEGDGAAGDVARPESPLLLVVDADVEASERVAMEAGGRGMRVRVVHGAADALVELAEEMPSAVLVDVSLPEPDSGRRLLAELTARAPAVPVVVLTAGGSFTDRVQAARLGAVAYLAKPLSAGEAVDAVQKVLRRGVGEGHRVLAVDDDPAVLAVVEQVLALRGVKVQTCPDPLEFWDRLEGVCPDVVVLDVDMPHVNGIELCRVMRNDSRWGATPVVFLTSRTDAETVERIFAAGADDFVSKPIVGPELATRVANRLERVQLHRALADTDPLTGVANRRRSEELMSQLLHLAVRQRQPLSLGLLDLDHFKDVNDQWGHGAGDEVLRRVGRTLQRSFRAEDVVARWGGEEFVVAMFGMDKEFGVVRLGRLLQQVSEDPIVVGPDGQEVRVSFSGGVAQFPGDGANVQELYRAADTAMYQAKAAGRARVLPAGWTPEQTEGPETVDVLVVEDDDALARMLLHALETRGYRSRWIGNGAEAARRLTGPRPSLRARVVLLDVDLPGMDGHAVLRQLAREHVLDRTRVIVVTVRTHESEVVQALEEGAFDHVAKPFSVPVLLQRIRRALRG